MDAVDILKKKNLKKSIQRIAIIDALQKRMRPLTEEEIKEEMGELYDRITFYRTMQTLVGAGIVHRVVVDKTMVEYAINNKGEECTMLISIARCAIRSPVWRMSLPIITTCLMHIKWKNVRL